MIVINFKHLFFSCSQDYKFPNLESQDWKKAPGLQSLRNSVIENTALVLLVSATALTKITTAVYTSAALDLNQDITTTHRDVLGVQCWSIGTRH